MAKQTINIGTTPNDGTGDALRNAFDKTNSNFTELYDGKQDDLVSGTNIKTVNGNSLLGSGDLVVGGSSGITVGTTSVTSGTVGRVFFEGSGNVVQQDSALFWDNTNKRLGVGATPATNARLDVRAQGALSTDLAFRVRNFSNSVSLMDFQGTGDLITRHTSSGSSLGLFHRPDTTGFSLSTGTGGYGTGTGLEVQGTSVWVLDAGSRLFRFTSSGGNDGDLWTFQNNGSGAGKRLSLGIGAESFVFNQTNFGIGTHLVGSGATKTLVIGNGTAPTTSPANCGQIYVEAGALKYRGSSGTVTTIAVA